MCLRAYIEHMTNLRVLIVDDAERVRQDLRTFLTLNGNIEIIGEACNGLEAIHLVQALHPQVVLMDLEMPFVDGFEAARQIKIFQPACRIIVLTIHGEEAEREKAFSAGADDFIVKGAPLKSLLEAIQKASTPRQMPKGD